jgi:hypothetical protein
MVPLLDESNDTFILLCSTSPFYHERTSEAEAKSHSVKLPQLQYSSKLMFISSPVFCEVHNARTGGRDEKDESEKSWHAHPALYEPGLLVLKSRPCHCLSGFMSLAS